MKFKFTHPRFSPIKTTVTYYPHAENNDFKFTLIISNKSILTSKQQHHIERKILGADQIQKFNDLLGALNIFTPIQLNESHDVLPVISQKLTIKSNKGLFLSITWTNSDELNYESHLRTVINLVTALQLEFSPEGLEVLKAELPGVIRPVYL